MSIEERIDKLTGAVERLCRIMAEHTMVLSQRTGISGHEESTSPADDKGKTSTKKKPAAKSTGKRETAAQKKKREAEEKAAAAAKDADGDLDDGFGDEEDVDTDDLLDDDGGLGDDLDDGLGDDLDDGLVEEEAGASEPEFSGIDATNAIKVLRDVLFGVVGQEVGKPALKNLLGMCKVTNISQITDADAGRAIQHTRKVARDSSVLKEWIKTCKEKHGLNIPSKA